MGEPRMLGRFERVNGGGMRHISVFAKCTLAKLELRRALNRFCDASGVERL